MYYHVKFGRSALQGVHKYERTLKIGERWSPAPLGGDVADDLKPIRPLPLALPRQFW